MTEAFEHTFIVGWADVDFNAHMRNSAILDRASDMRMLYATSKGFGTKELLALRIGPVVMRDELEYFREFLMGDEFRVNYRVAGLAPDCSRFRLRNEFFKPDGTLAARVTSTGGYIDLDRRKLVAPPDSVRDYLRAIARTEDFTDLPSSIKSGAVSA
jgi:acyl-CoA thioester hydrolase